VGERERWMERRAARGGKSTRIRISTALPNHASAEPGIPRTRTGLTLHPTVPVPAPDRAESTVPIFRSIRQIPNTSSYTSTLAQDKGQSPARGTLCTVLYVLCSQVPRKPIKKRHGTLWNHRKPYIGDTYVHYACLLESSLSLPAGPLLCGLNSR
jgi:hypothetical protein